MRTVRTVMSLYSKAYKRTNHMPGMFLFVKLVMTNLYNQTTKGQLCAELQKRFPRCLEQAYVADVYFLTTSHCVFFHAMVYTSWCAQNFSLPHFLPLDRGLQKFNLQFQL